MSSLAIMDTWKQQTLSPDIIAMHSGFASPLKHAVAIGVPHLRPFNIGDNGELDLSRIVYISSEYEQAISVYKLQPGDILFNNTNSVELVGKSAIVRTAIDCTFSNHVTRLRIVDEKRLSPEWLAVCLRVFWKNEFFAKQAHRWIGQAGFNPGKLAEIQIPCPNLETQHRITNRVKALLADLGVAHKTLNQMKHDMSQVLEAVLAEVFNTSTLNGWANSKKLEKLVTISARQVDPRLSEYKHLPQIGVKSIESGACRLGTYHTAEEEQIISKNYLFAAGDILYSKIRPYLRKAALVDFKGLCSADIYPLTILSSEIFPRFLLWSLIGPQFTDYTRVKSGRARMQKINQEELFAYELSYPSYDEQQYIANYLDSTQREVDRILKTIQDNDELLKQVEQSILYEAFRGEL